MLRFKLLRGIHEDSNGRHKKGDIVESDKPLDKLFNAPSCIKFERILETSSKPSSSSSSTPSTSSSEDLLAGKTIAELRAFAEEQEIDLEGATKKREILDVLKEALA